MPGVAIPAFPARRLTITQARCARRLRYPMQVVWENDVRDVAEGVLGLSPTWERRSAGGANPAGAPV